MTLSAIEYHLRVTTVNKNVLSQFSGKRVALSFCLLLMSFNANVHAQLLISNRADDNGLPQISIHDPETGALQRVLVSGDSATNGGLFFPSAMTVGPNNELMVASQMGSILRYDLDSGDFLGTFAEQLALPSGLLYNAANDELLVTTLGNFDSELTFRYNATSGELISTIGEGTGASGRGSLVTGPDGNVYVSSFANGDFFLGEVLQLDAETLTTNVFATNPLLGMAGASGLAFHETETSGNYFLDVVGLFSNSVARFDVTTTEAGLTVGDSRVLIGEGLDFPSAILPLGDGTMLITSLGNDNPSMGDLRAGSISRYDVSTGEFIDTFVTGDGANAIPQPNALLLLSPADDLDCNGDGVVDANDLTCACASGLSETLADLNLIKGDFDADGEVGFSDFLILSDSFSKDGDYVKGDMDCSGVVEFADFLEFSGNFGQTSNVAAAVPEPHAITLTLLGGLTFLSLRRRRMC